MDPEDDSLMYTRACDGCGYRVERKVVSSMQRWGAACRICNRKGWNRDEHARYLAKLEASHRKDSGTVSSSSSGTVRMRYKCPSEGCKRNFVLFKKLQTHVLRVHKWQLSSEASVKRVPESQFDKLPQGKRRLASSTFPGEQDQKKKKKKKRDPKKLQKRLNAAPGVSPMYQKSALGLYRDNLVRWDDSLRNRLGLLPMQAPVPSPMFETTPTRMYRLAIVKGKLSRSWNQALDLPQGEVFGLNHVEQALQRSSGFGMARILRRAKRKQGNDGLEASNSSSSSAIGSTNNATGPSDDPLDLETVAELGEFVREPPGLVLCSSLAPSARIRLRSFLRRQPLGNRQALFDSTSCGSSKQVYSEEDLLPIPLDAPLPPGQDEFDESLWIEEASRLLRSIKQRKEATDPTDPFVRCGLPVGLESESAARLRKRADRIAALQDAADLRETDAQVTALPSVKPISRPLASFIDMR